MTTDLVRRARVDGVEVPLVDATFPVLDEGIVRGDAAFETIGVWDGQPFRQDDHLQRLAASAARILHARPDLDALREDVAGLLRDVDGDAVLRLYVSVTGLRVVTLDRPPVRPDAVRLVPRPAPWIRPSATYGPAGAKTTSYLHNMIATRAAQAEGGDDALLLSLEGKVLEGPTFAVYWVTDGVLHAPEVDLGIVDSISRRTVLELARAQGIAVIEGAWTIDAVAAADEVLLTSAVRSIVRVRRVGVTAFDGPTPVGDALERALDAARRT